MRDPDYPPCPACGGVLCEDVRRHGERRRRVSGIVERIGDRRAGERRALRGPGLPDRRTQ